MTAQALTPPAQDPAPSPSPRPPGKSDPGDLRPGEFPELTWETKDLAANLNRLRHYATHEALSAIRWYLDNRRNKRLWGWLLRLGAILATSVAGILPMLATIYADSGGKPNLSPIWSTIALGVGATLVLLDRYWGFTTAWVRYMLAEIEISRLLKNFYFEWENDKLAWQDDQPTRTQAAAMAKRCGDFLAQVDGLVREETRRWAGEFQSVLKQVDDAARVAADFKYTPPLRGSSSGSDTPFDPR